MNSRTTTSLLESWPSQSKDIEDAGARSFKFIFFTGKKINLNDHKNDMGNYLVKRI